MEEKIKKSWQETRFNPSENPQQLRDIMDGRRRTALDSLARRYRAFSNIGFIMAAVSVCWYFSPLFGDMGPVISLSMIAYFLLCGSMDNWFCRGVQSIDVATMSVSEVASKALYYRKRHLQAIALLIPIALVLISLMIYARSGDPALLYGLVAGALFGAAIGCIHLRRFLADYRRLSN